MDTNEENISDDEKEESLTPSPENPKSTRGSAFEASSRDGSPALSDIEESLTDGGKAYLLEHGEFPTTYALR